MKKKVLFVALIVLVLVTAFACTVPMERAGKTIERISVNGINVLEYIAGDPLNIDGANIVVTYSDGSTESVDLDRDMLSGFDMDVPELGKKIIVTFGGVETYFTVDVLDLNFKSVELASTPYKTDYIVGEDVDPDGATLNIIYEGGKTVNRPITRKDLGDYDNETVGACSIKINYHGFELSFVVNFEEKTVTEVTVVREPKQGAVFLGYGERLSLEGMQVKLTYDNGREPIVAATDISDDIKVFIDDTSKRTVDARVAYLPKDAPRYYNYSFAGNALVGRNAFVTPGTELASNGILDNVTSKSFGRVDAIVDGNIKIDTVVDYEITETVLKVGQILLRDEFVGRFGGSNVYAEGGGGVVLAIVDGKVTVQTCPVGKFKINVQDRSYASMEIQTYPKTTKYASTVDNITQGDTLDLSTGVVKVYFDNGETAFYPMNSSNFISVTNSDDDMRRSEIPGLEFESVDDITGLPAGIYNLAYNVKHGYGDRVSVVASVIDEKSGDFEFVYEDQRRVSLSAGKNYTVSLTASMFDNGVEKVSEYSYHISTQGAPPRQKQLDITAAGWHKLTVTYGGVAANSIPLIVNVIQRYPVRLNIVDTSDNISGRNFWLGSTIPLSTLRYYVTYNNGDESEPTGVTTDLLDENSSLLCDRVTANKEIKFKISGVEAVTLNCNVVPVPITNVAFIKDPNDTFLTAQAMNGSNDVSLAGGVLKITYASGAVDIIGDDNESLDEYKGRGDNEKRFTLAYDPADDTPMSIDDIYENGVHYVGTLTYYDEYNESASCTFAYYYIDMSEAASAIRVLYRAEIYKDTYVQCEDWDLSGISLSVTLINGTTKSLAATRYMVYDSTTDVIGRNIPLKFKYLGKTDDTTLKINVEPRMETSLSVRTTGKDTYFNTDRSLDLTAYRFTIGYNAGASAEIVGINEYTGSRTSEGWWYELLDSRGNPTTFRKIETKTVRLYHTSISDSDIGTVYTIVMTEFEVTVNQNTTGIASVSYDDVSLGTYQDLPVLSETAAGWDLFLHEYVGGVIENKLLTIHYEHEDGEPEQLGYVELTSDMLSYNRFDISRGYRKVIITYKGHSTQVYVRVRTASLTSIEVERTPTQNFIAGSELSLEGGILKLVYDINESGLSAKLYKYVNMDSGDVSISGYNKDINPELDNVKQAITLTFHEKTTTYTVTIFNKQTLNFVYQNTIFFYGNTKKADATPVQLIPEFTLPQGDGIKMYYVCNDGFIAEAEFTGDENDYVKLLTETGYYYVLKSALSSSHFIEPAPRGYDYYIVMEVSGNDFYKAENYALKKFTIIPKVIEVTTVDYTEYAFVKTYTKAGDALAIPNAVFDLYHDLSSVVRDLKVGKITDIELLSPNATGFEIGVFVTSAFDATDPDDLSALNAVFTAVETYLDGRHISLNTSGAIRKGVNIGQYNGKTPEYVSYRVAAGETLTLNDVLELLSGKLSLSDTYDYGVGEYAVSLGTLGHNNYNIDFNSGKTGKYYVTARELRSSQWVTYGGGSWNGATQTLTINNGQTPTINVYGEGYSRKLDADEVNYYTDSGRTVEVAEGDLNANGVPVVAGTYYAKVAKEGAFVKDGAPVSLDFILIVN